MVAHSGAQSALRHLKSVLVGQTPEHATRYPILESAWMPRGWKLKLQGLETDLEVKELRGAAIYAERSALPPPEEGEYYVSDLVGLPVLDADSGEMVGTFAGVESAGQDRWWVQGEGKMIPVPATKRYIRLVDIVSRKIWLQNLGDLE